MDSSIKFNVSANTAQFQSGMRQVDTAAKSTAAGIKTAFAGVGNLLMGGAALAGLKSLMNDFDRIGKLATRFGTSAESIQRVSVAAQVAGTDVEAVANAMTKAGIAASNAVEKGGQMADLFKRAGISAKEFASAQLDEKLLMVSRAFQAAGNDADKTNAIIEIMGSRAGANLIPLISDLDALQAEMAGVAVASSDTIKKIEEANDTFTRLENTLKVGAAKGLGLTSFAFEAMTAAIMGATKQVTEGGGGWQYFLDILRNLDPASAAAATGVNGVASAVNDAAANMAELNKQMAQWESDFSRRFKEPAEQVAILQEQINELVREYEYDPQKETLQEIKKLTEERLRLEDQITKETAKQAEQLAKEQEARNQSRLSLEEETQLLRARRLGDVGAEERILQDRDTREALKRTGGDLERASNFAAEQAATRAAERSAGRARDSKTPLEQLEEKNDENSNAARGRINRNLEPYERRAQEQEAGGMFRSAAKTRARGEERAQREAARELGKAAMRELGASNSGELYKKLGDEMLKQGPFARDKAIRDALGKEYDKTRDPQSNLEDLMRDVGTGKKEKPDWMKGMEDKAKTPEEKAEEPKTETAEDPGGGGTLAKPATEATLKLILDKIQERPILVA